MNAGNVLDLFRSEMKDESAPYLWSDVDVFRYIDDAQKMFCRLTDGISDASTTSVVDIAAPVGAEWLKLHASILKIRSANRVSDGRPLEILNHEDMAGRGLRFDGRTGPLTTLIVGMEENKARAYPKVAVADSVKLLVFRLPREPIDQRGAEFEISEQHHMHLLLWAKAQALLKQDAETFDKSKADEFEAKFRGYCAEVKVEQARKRHKVRTVAYGGI